MNSLLGKFNPCPNLTSIPTRGFASSFAKLSSSDSGIANSDPHFRLLSAGTDLIVLTPIVVFAIAYSMFSTESRKNEPMTALMFGPSEVAKNLLSESMIRENENLPSEKRWNCLTVIGV